MTDTSDGMERRAAVRTLLKHRDAAGQDGLVISGLGSATWDVAAAGDRPTNFYLWGAMGGAVSIGLGLALARPDRAVAVITGDGEMLMGMGSLATVCRHAPENLSIAVLDNARYGETGMQRSATAGDTDLVGVARGCGFRDAVDIRAEAELDAFAVRAFAKQGLAFARIVIAPDDPERVLPIRDGVLLKDRFQKAIDRS